MNDLEEYSRYAKQLRDQSDAWTAYSKTMEKIAFVRGALIGTFSTLAVFAIVLLAVRLIL